MRLQTIKYVHTNALKKRKYEVYDAIIFLKSIKVFKSIIL